METRLLFLNIKGAITLSGNIVWSWHLNWMWWMAYCLCVPLLSVQRWPLSVHLVKGLSAAGVEAESEGSSRVRTSTKECLWVHVDGRGALQLARDEGRQTWSLCSCHIDPRLSSKITFFSLGLPKTSYCLVSGFRKHHISAILFVCVHGNGRKLINSHWCVKIF